ncbi:MAG: hypothetical protein ABJA79_04745 [Parafilimonas sp.]
MSTDSIIKEIEKLSIEDRLMLVEKAIRSLRKSKQISLEQAVQNLYKELIIFTNLDFENFYEAR